MAKKVAEYGLFIRALSAVGRAEAGSRSKAEAMAELHAEYPPEKGWEIAGVEFGGFIGPENAYTVIFAMQRMVDESLVGVKLTPASIEDIKAD